MQGSLILFPITLGDTLTNHVLPDFNADLIRETKYFIVENIRTARRFLKKIDSSIVIDDLTFYELNKHTNRNELENYLIPIDEGSNIGVMSEAGCPAIADPGADVVAIAQHRGIKVIPLVGPSSILLSMMASGFNGQSFSFQGYLPIENTERVKKIKQMENRIFNENQTQIFIETPYRNDKMVQDILKNCSPSIKLCIAMNITCDDEYIRTQPIKNWINSLPDMNKKNCIFLLYK